MLDDLLQRFRRRDRNALARLLSRTARGEGVDAILAAIGPPARPARVVALTGGGGVGKSTLAGKLVEQARRHGLTVAVLACDPQSPLTGGALLGDRFRMPSRPNDDGVFIRSLAAAGGRGAVAEHLGPLIRVCEAFGFDVVLVETVGAGQGDTAVRALADVLVLLLQPETGDDLQWEKAGLLEVADVVVIHKADLPGAERVEAQVLAALALSSSAAPPVLRVSARTGEGVEALWAAIAACPLRRADRDAGAELLRLAQETLAARFTAARTEGAAALRNLLSGWRGGELDAAQAVAAMLRLLEQFARPMGQGP
jgi:LAO/AO transport system ATPase